MAELTDLLGFDSPGYPVPAVDSGLDYESGTCALPDSLKNLDWKTSSIFQTASIFIRPLVKKWR